MIGSRVRTLVDRYFEDDIPAGTEGIVEDYDDGAEDYKGRPFTQVAVTFPSGLTVGYDAQDVEEVL